MELMIVIAIIGILASIVLASLNSARIKARRASALSSVSSAMAELAVCSNDGGDASATAPSGGTTPVCCEDDTCATAMSGHNNVIWPDIGTTGWNYLDDPTGSLDAGDYVITVRNVVTGDIITCEALTGPCR